MDANSAKHATRRRAQFAGDRLSLNDHDCNAATAFATTGPNVVVEVQQSPALFATDNIARETEAFAAALP